MLTSASYGIYWTAKRYILPLIAPPTPPQLEQDKAGIDASFDKAFALLDQLATDTADLKSAEAARKERLDTALGEVESVIARMKSANDEREIEAKRIAREIQELRDLVPKALEKEKGVTEGRLQDLVGEVKSLKVLVGNRMGGGAAANGGRATPSFSSSTPATAPTPAKEEDKPLETSATAQTPSYTAPVYSPSSTNTTTQAREVPGSNSSAASSTPYSRLLDRGGKGSGGAAIPSWQLAAKKKSEEAKAAEASNGVNGNVAESGTATEMVDAST